MITPMWHIFRRYRRRPVKGLLAAVAIAVLAGVATAEEFAMPAEGLLVNVPNATRAYEVGERLDYRISWGGVTAGHATMAVHPGTTEDGKPAYLLTSTTHSSKAISWFYKVRDRVVSQIDPVTGVPYRIDIDQRHGKRKRIRTTVFDQAAQRATTYQKGREPVQVDTPPMVHDILSCLYYLRSLPSLEPHTTHVVDVHEGKKNWRLLVKTLDRERINTVAGTFDTIPVKAEVRFKGVFFDRGDVRIWFSDDARHIPVLIRIKIRLGHVTIQLTGSHLEGSPPISVG